MPDLVFNPQSCPVAYPVKKVTSRVHIARFGNGYEQRARDGINATRAEWSIIFSMLTRAEADNIERFIVHTAGGHTAFKWTVPFERTEGWYHYRINTFTRTQIAPNAHELRFSIEEAYGR